MILQNMKVLIVEDEKMARDSLARTIRENFPNLEITGMTDSVSATIDWLRDNRVDIIFMDVELSDGNCFEIFRRIRIDANVVMTTAYDSYALKAFEAGSIDYLLKPVEMNELTRAIERCHRQVNTVDIPALLAAIEHKKDEYKTRFVVHIGERLIILNTCDIAYFYSENKSNYITTVNGAHYIIDTSMDSIAEELNPKEFFRISRSCIISMKSIRSITRQSGSRLCINSCPAADFEMTVSRSRVDDFLRWLE